VTRLDCESGRYGRRAATRNSPIRSGKPNLHSPRAVPDPQTCAESHLSFRLLQAMPTALVSSLFVDQRFSRKSRIRNLAAELQLAGMRWFPS
jgi:hypothetical protein